MDGKLRMPQTATYIPICRMVEDEAPQRLTRSRRKHRGASRVLLACTLIFACAVAVQKPELLETVQTKAVNLAPLLEELGSRTRGVVQAFAGSAETVVTTLGEVPGELPDDAGADELHIDYYGESPAPVWAQTTAAATTAAATVPAATTATAATTASTAPAATAATVQTVSSDLDGTTNWPDIVTASVQVPVFDYTLPVSGTITSDFGYRDHPVDGEVKFHYGVDIAASEGTPIGAFADGTVIYTGVGEINGNYIKIRHADGYVSLYAHMSEICVGWGQTVKKGDLVGKVGQTGIVTGPHLHLQLYHDGLLFDPVLLLGDALGV